MTISDQAGTDRATVRRIVCEVAPTDVDTCGSDAVLVDDLAYHSLALLELAFALEDEFDLPPMDDHAAQNIRTVSDVEEFVLAALQERSG